MIESSSGVLFVVNHFGLICFVLAFFLAGLQKLYSLARVKKNPELAEGYPKIILGYLIFMGLPWLIFAIGELVYGFSSVFLIFMLKDGNLFSWLFFVILFCEYVFLIIWVWFRGGGDYLYKYRLLFYKFSSPLAAKLFITLTVLGGTVAMALLISMNFSALSDIVRP